MKMIRLCLLGMIVLLFCLPQQLSGQCLPDSTVPNIPGIYPDTLPVAVGCQYFEEDITVVMPRDTNTALGTFPFNFFQIDSIAGLPPGMQWECNLAPDCKYITHPDSVNADTLGCIRLFGTPTIAGTYSLQALVTAELVIFGNPSLQPVTFNFPLTVSPCQFGGDCYTLTLSSNCEPAVLDIVNEIPSNGEMGFRYDWEITGPNGFLYTTTDEQAATQMFTDPGSYVVNYEAVIDTVGFVLNGVTIDSTECTDLFGTGAGDLYWILIDSAGNELINTIATPITNGTDLLPLSTGISSVFLDTGMYEFQVWDEDSNLPLDNPDGCATGANGSGASVFFQVPPPADSFSVTVDGLRVIFEIDNPMFVFECSDTLEVHPLPDEPALLMDGDTLSVTEINLCAGDTLILSTSSTDSLQWYISDSVKIGSPASDLVITEAGTYRVEAIDRDQFCTTTSTSITVNIVEVPTPAIDYDGMGNLMVLSPDPAYIYEWYQSIIGLAGTGTNFTPTSSGDYTAVAVDTMFGCRSEPSSSRNVIVTSIDDLSTELQHIRLYPNPTSGPFYVELEFVRPQTQLRISLSDVTGRTLLNRSWKQIGGLFRETIERENLASGLYLLTIQTENGLMQRKLLIQKE
ncbi:MAG: T9SS type A sorting domain-containing protein [Bacteroidota bacterium]